MKKQLPFILLIALLYTVCSCEIIFPTIKIPGDKNIIETSISITDFNKISCSFPLTVMYSQSQGMTTATLKTDANIVPYLDIYVENGTLIIQKKNEKEQRGHQPEPTFCELTISSSVLNDISVSGSGMVNITTPFNSRSIRTAISGSGQINFLYDVTSDNFSAGISGSGKISTYKLEAAKVNMAVSGSGEAFSDEIYAEQFSAALSGSGNIESNKLQSKNISNSMSGSGSIHNGKIKSQKYECAISGSGKITGEGVTNEAVFAIAGSGEIITSNLKANYVNSSISGSGKVYITVIERLDSEVVGSGKVFYSGQPQTVNNSIQGSGGVRKVE